MAGNDDNPLVADLTRQQRACLKLDRNLAVVAGAGSGKTRVLTRRYLRILERKQGTVQSILAVTFTEKAAAEMLDRVRQTAAELADAGTGPEARRWCRVAEDLADARIQTIHSLCASLLREYPLEAGVDPYFQVIQGPDQQELLEETVADLLRRRSRDPERPLPADLVERWGQADLLEVLLHLVARRATTRRWAEQLCQLDETAILDRYLEEVFAEVRQQLIAVLTGPAFLSAEQAVRALADCGAKPADKLKTSIDAVAVCLDGWSETQRAEGAAAPVLPDLQEILLTKSGSVRRFGGAKGNWKDASVTLDAARDAMTAMGEQVQAMDALAERLPGALDELMIADLKLLAELAIEAMDAYRQAKGDGRVLDFDDLLIGAERLLAGDRAVRLTIAERFHHVLVDEFQDTNALQWRILRRLAHNAKDTMPEAGVFVVGDQKQSIYAFRGADVRVFGSTCRELADGGGAIQPLADNFRTLRRPLAFVNELFDRVLSDDEDPDIPPQPLRCRRSEEEPGGVELLLAIPEDDEDALTGIHAEADLVAKRIAQLLGDHTDMAASGHGTPPVAPQDVAILLRRRTHLKVYEDALRRHGVPFAVVGGTGFYARPEVADTANLLAYLCDPRQDIALAGLLRSPLCGVTDKGLLAIARTEESNLTRKMEAAAETGDGLEQSDHEAVKRFVDWLREWTANVDQGPPAQLLRDVFDQTGLWGAYGVDPRAEQAVANLRKVLDLARDFQRGGFRSLKHLADQFMAQIDRAYDEAEADVPLEELGGVRVLTIHQAKGLEFPVVVVPDLNRRPRAVSASILIETIDGRPYTAVKVPDPRDAFELGKPGLWNMLVEERRRKERSEDKRLFYVACTRARDMLVLAGHVRADDDEVKFESGSWMAWVCRHLGPDTSRSEWQAAIDAGEVRFPIAPHNDGGTGLTEVPVRVLAALPDADRTEGPSDEPLYLRFGNADLKPSAWAQTVRARLQGLQSPPAVLTLSPTAYMTYKQCPRRYFLKQHVGMPDDWRSEALNDLEGEDAPRKAIGQAVHERLAGTLEDAAIESRLTQLLGKPNREAAMTVRKHVARFMESDFGKQLLSCESSHDELKLITKLDELTYLETRIDRLYHHDGQWHVLDYKTNSVDSLADAERIVEERDYGTQMACYALAVAGMTEPSPSVVPVHLFFTKIGKDLPDEPDSETLERLREEVCDAASRIRQKEFHHADNDDACRHCGYRGQGVCDAADASQA